MKTIFGILILIMTITQSYGQDSKPKITQSPSSDLPSIGSQITFSCNFSTGINQCEWLKDDQVIGENPNYKATNADGHCELVIQSFSNDNAGTYACRLPSQQTEKNSDKITIPAKALNAENDIKDNSPAGRSGPIISDRFPELTYPQNTTAEPGTDVTLVCKFPNVAQHCYWEKDGKTYVLSETNSDPAMPHYTGNRSLGDCSIIIPNVAMKYDGFYKCVLPIVVGETGDEYISNEIKVTILARPSVPEMEYKGNIVKNGEIRVREEETDIIIKCIVRDGNPAAELKWYKQDGTEIIGNVIVTRDNNTGLSTVTNEINVLKSEYNQRAVASCNATHESYTTNTSDHMMSVTAILILEGPVQEVAVTFSNTTDKTLKIKDGQEAFMNCTVHAEPQPEYEWQRADVIESQTKWTKFGEAKPTQVAKVNGHYRCGARNEKNNGQYKHSDEHLKLEVESPEKTLQAGAIFGIVFGVVVILALVAWLVYYAYSREKWCFKRRATTTTRQVPMAEIRRTQESKPLRHE